MLSTRNESLGHHPHHDQNHERPLRGEPSGVCRCCEQADEEEMDPRWRPIVDWVKEHGHSEEEAREIVEGMADLTREVFRR